MPRGVVVIVGVAAHWNRHAIGLAGTCALALTEVTAVGEPFNVVVVAVLGRPNLSLKAQHLGPVFAQRTIHVGVTAHHLGHPLHKGVKHQGVICQIGGLQELHLGMVLGHPLGVLLDPTHQHPGKQEIGENDNPAIAKSHHLAKSRLHQRKGDPGINRFTPAKTKTLHQHPRHLGDIGVGIGVGRAPAHHDQHGFVQGHLCGCPIKDFANPGPGGLNHLQVNPQFTAVVDAQTRLCRVGIEHRGDVVFGVARCKQHGRHGQHVAYPPGPQRLQAIAQDRPGKFQVAVFHRHLGQQRLEPLGQLGKFGHCQPIAAAVAANQHPNRAVGTGTQVGMGEGSHGHSHLRPTLFREAAGQDGDIRAA